MKLKNKFTLKEVCGMYVPVGIGSRSDDSNRVVMVNDDKPLVRVRKGMPPVT